MIATVRICRACGCSDQFACPGGCAWAAADRCTACPPERPSIHPINGAHVQACRFTETMSLALGGGGYLRRYLGFDYPSLTAERVTSRAHSLQQRLFFKGEEVSWSALDEVAAHLNANLRSAA